MPGQLHDISEAIGELRGLVKGIDVYVHDNQHGVNNLSQKVDALGTKITRDIAAVEARIDAKLDSFAQTTNARLIALEIHYQQQTGAKNLAVWLLESPLIAWLFAAAVMAYAYLTGKPK